MGESTWESRDLPILEAIRAIEIEYQQPDRPRGVPNVPRLVEQAQLPDHVVRAGLLDLYEANYLSGAVSQSMGRMTFDIMNYRLTERGRRAVGQWPTEQAYDSLLQVLSQRIESEPEPDKRRALEKIRDGALSAGREVSVAVLTAWVKSQVGVP